MAPSQKLKSLITSFTPDGDFLAILYLNGTVKIWNTGNANLLADWNLPDSDPIGYSCMACSFVGKKRKKEKATFLLGVGTNDGDVFTIDAFTGDTKWKSSGRHPGGVAGLTFSNKGHSLYTVGASGLASEINSVSGEVIREFKASKNPISSLAFSDDKKILAVSSGKPRVRSLESGKELLKFRDDMDPVQYISVSNNAKAVITSGPGEKQLQLWSCNPDSNNVTRGSILSMQDPVLAFECKGNEEEEDGLAVLAISESGAVYAWTLKVTSQAEVDPTNITVKANKTESKHQKVESAKKSRQKPIFAARLHALRDDGQVAALIAYGSVDSPCFHIVNISNSGKSIVINATNETISSEENGILARKDLQDLESEAALSTQNKKTKKKRAASDLEPATTKEMADSDHDEARDGVLDEDDLNEPTMGDKLASLHLQENDESKNHEEQESSPHAKPPSADSVNILLKQALHADDRNLLLDCLYTQDEKVITNSISILNPSDVLKLLQALVSIIQSRGAIVACALPWLRSLLLQHATGIMSQESSPLVLNSLYQLIESRVSTFQTTIQLSSCIDFVFAGVIGHSQEDEHEIITPIIYEDKDDSDEDYESEDAMDTDQDSKEEEPSGDELGDLELSDGMNE